MRYVAHINDRNEEQLLKDHLLQVAELAREYAEIFHAGELGYAAGLLHDLGKYKQKFQARIRGQPVAVTHSTAGALTIRDKTNWSRMFGTSGIHRMFAELVAYTIAFHHGGLRNYGTKDEDGSLCWRMEAATDDPDEQPQLWSDAWDEIELPVLPIPFDSRLIDNLRSNPNRVSWKMAFLGRMLYSCLVDADTVDTRNFCSPQTAALPAPNGTSIAELSERLDRYMSNRYARVDDTVVNRYRQSILDTCRRRASLKPGMFSLTVPTGGGKTFSSLAFALRHAHTHKQRRIIYVIPFSSIIEQNASHFRRALGEESVLEHHSNFNWKESTEHLEEADALRIKLSAENWDAPVIVTTSVQFFESLFGNKRSKLRKLHNIAGSVIVIDEAQSLPRGYLEPCLRALEELVEGYGCSVVLCTATQPSWGALGRDIAELMDSPSPDELFDAFKRVEVTVHEVTETSDETIASWMMNEHQALCIVNTRKHAKLLFDRFCPATDGLYHLSGRMTPMHRLSVLEEIRECLNPLNPRPCRVISTQLIEAGVDVDFPVVIRAMAGLDSIAQAAGRCNRNGLLDVGRVIVFHPEKHGMPTRGWLKETSVEAANSLRRFGESNTLSRECIQDYFERIHGLRDEEAGPRLRDQEGIVALLSRQPPDIPYQEVADRFRFIDSDMETIVVPWMPKSRRENEDDPYDPEALRLIDNELKTTSYPASILRQLQPYTVQVYRHELKICEREGLVRNVQGIWVLNDLSHYDERSGLLLPEDGSDQTVYIF